MQSAKLSCLSYHACTVQRVLKAGVESAIIRCVREDGGGKRENLVENSQRSSQVQVCERVSAVHC